MGRFVGEEVGVSREGVNPILRQRCFKHLLIDADEYIGRTPSFQGSPTGALKAHLGVPRNHLRPSPGPLVKKGF